MNWSFRKLFVPAAVAVPVACACLALYGEPPTADAVAEPAGVKRLTVEEARAQARLLQTTYEATLHVIHRRYFDADEKDTIPAKALEDVFRLADEGTGRSTRWIAVSTPAMNVDHKPTAGFEQSAAEALKSGEREFESVENGTYRRAGAITLFASCLRCHESGLTKQITKERVAAIVVNIPVGEEKIAE